MRVCGAGAARRLEFRLPGADANPYLELRGRVIIAGLAGVDEELEPPAASDGNGYRSSAPPLPRDIGEAIERFARSELAVRALGAGVHEHVVRLAQHEHDLGRQLVTDVELARGFEVA